MHKCKLCGGEFKSLEMHLTSCLKKYNITREMYTDLDSDPVIEVGSEEPVVTQPKREGVVTQKEAIDNTFNVKKRDPDRPLSEALKEFNITEHEFISILKHWKGEGDVPLQMRMNQKMNIGREIAKKYKDQQSVEVTVIEAAEVLIKEYGFDCIEVKHPPKVALSTWVMTKK